MTRWDDGCYEIRYFYNNEYPDLTAHRFMFCDFDFLEHTMLLERLTKNKKLTVSEFKVIVNKAVFLIRFIKIRKIFNRVKIIITVSSSEDEWHRVRVKNQSRAELNEWINKCLDDATLFNNTISET